MKIKQTRNDDTLEVRLSDSLYNYYYKKKVKAGNTKEIRTLIDDLKYHGIDIERIMRDDSMRWF